MNRTQAATKKDTRVKHTEGRQSGKDDQIKREEKRQRQTYKIKEEVVQLKAPHLKQRRSYTGTVLAAPFFLIALVTVKE